MEIILFPGHVDVALDLLSLLIEESHPGLHTGLLDGHSVIIFSDILEALVECKIFKCFSGARSLVLDSLNWPFNVLFLAREEEESGVAAHLEL